MHFDYINDDFELEASFTSNDALDAFNKKIVEFAYYNNKTHTDFRGKPYIKFEYSKGNELVLCGKDTDQLIKILNMFNDVMINSSELNKYNIETYKEYIRKAAKAEKEKENGIKIISW